MAADSLSIGIDTLLEGGVESARLKLKASWDPETTGHQVLKTICAFANDLYNLNGGYLVIGLQEAGGAAVRPARGLSAHDLEAAQKWIRGNCKRIEPGYMPLLLPREVDGQQVLVVRATVSDNRPHQAPDGPKGMRKYWVRVGSETVEATAELLTMLLQQTARVPFDDRRALPARNTDLSFALVAEFLREVHSELAGEVDAERVYRAMQLVSPVNGHTVPRNVALLFFCTDPERWFRGARIEVVEFQDDAGGNTLTEYVFRGPLHHQVRQCLTKLESMTARYTEKSGVAMDARGWLSFPLPALREALVNALYHRSYEDSVEPTKVYLYPNRIEVISYPGPLPGIELAHLSGSQPVPPVPARNRRIGEYLKELRLAEARGTGLPKIRRSMQENGSPSPIFDFDAHRSYFRVTLPAHAEHVALTLLRNYAYGKATGNAEGALASLERAWHDGFRSPSIAAVLVREWAERQELDRADALVASVAASERTAYAVAFTALAEAHVKSGQPERSRAVLDALPDLLAGRDACEAAILERRLRREDRAHQLFLRAGDLVLQDPRALHEFAQSKLALTRPLAKSRRLADQETRSRLLREASAYLERVTQLSAPNERKAWAWYDLGRARVWQGHPTQSVVEAYQRAIELLPSEPRFAEALQRVRR